MVDRSEMNSRQARHRAYRAVVGWLAGLLVCGACGCRPTEPTGPADAGAGKAPSEKPGQVATSPVSSAGGKVDEDAGQGRQTHETWDAVFMGGSKVGHTRTRFATLEQGDQRLVKITADSQMTMLRFNQTVSQEITVVSVEHPDGRLVRFLSSMGTAPNETKTEGRVEGGKLRMTTTTPGKSHDSALDWSPDCRGFFGAEQSLREDPLEPGEQRTVRALMAVFNMIGQVELTAVDYEPTRLLSGEQTLLRIESSTQIGPTRVQSVLWTDEQGETLKTAIPSLGQETFRTTRAVALRADGNAAPFDLGAASVVKTDRRLAHPHRTRRIVYRATIDAGDPVATFAVGATQAVKRLDARTAEITVQALRPENAAAVAVAKDRPPTEQDLAASSLIQSDDPAVIEIAQSVAADETDAWQVAQALEKRVQELVDVTEFSQAIASAAEVAKSRQGDCTEHAMLLAAACRARQIPARVAIGLVYYGQAGGFAYHMWTEVWVGDHWIPLDATLGQGGIGAAHVKVAESNLASGSGYAAVLPVFEVMGRLQLEIVAVDEPG